MGFVAAGARPIFDLAQQSPRPQPMNVRNWYCKPADPAWRGACVLSYDAERDGYQQFTQVRAVRLGPTLFQWPDGTRRDLRACRMDAYFAEQERRCERARCRAAKGAPPSE